MATILEQYRKRQNEIREQIAANSLPLDQMLIMQELNYRICVLETFESLCKSAPVTMDTKAMGFHFQLVDAYGTYLWDPAYKGLDDYIWEYLFRKKQS